MFVREWTQSHLCVQVRMQMNKRHVVHARK
jgi:hypothetical protein